MANRIMHSILPAVADKSQVVTTDGIIDAASLDAAIYGRKDVLKYGVRACVKEISHYCQDIDLSWEKREQGRRSIINIRSDANDRAKTLAIAIEIFSDESGWETNYGGFKWLQIAKSLARLDRLDKYLDQVKKEKELNRNPKSDVLSRETNIKKQILMELNVFDGLSHNSASILENLVFQESNELFNKFLEQKLAVPGISHAEREAITYEMNDLKSKYYESEYKKIKYYGRKRVRKSNACF
jgi:hypothetical protein